MRHAKFQEHKTWFWNRGFLKICLQYILTDFKNTIPRLNVDKQHSYEFKCMIQFSIIVVHLLKISLSSNKFNVLKTSFIEDRVHLFSKTIGISRICRVFILSKLTK